MTQLSDAEAPPVRIFDPAAAASPGTPPTQTASGPAAAMEGLVRYSRALGADTSLVLRGGGNTSVKVDETDVAGRPVRMLRVKGSGSDLASAKQGDFAGVRLDDVLPLFGREDMSDEEMVAYLARCLASPSDPRPSIETLLHAFIPAASVFHSHADAILSLVNNPDPHAALDAALGPDVLRVPYRRPGFLLSREVGEAVRAAPDAPGLVLLNHGLVTWGATPDEAYQRHVDLVDRARAWLDAHRSIQPFGTVRRPALEEDARRGIAARIAPVIRGALGGGRAAILRYSDAPEVLELVGSAEGRGLAEQGAATPDHILTTGRLPLWVDARDPADFDGLAAAFRSALDAYRAAYAGYVGRWGGGREPLDAPPRIILVPGIGMFTAGATARTAGLARDIYLHTIGIMRGAAPLGGYRTLAEEDAFHAEYWPLELYKLSLAPPPKEMEGRVALVTGAAGALGRAIAVRLAAAGAHVVVTDVDAARTADTTREVASGDADRAIAQSLDVTRAGDVDAAWDAACLAFGGVDVVVSNAGIAHCSSIEAMELADWERSLAVNATGHFLVTRAALRHFRAQGRGGSIVFVATKNVTAPGRDFAAYSASKAAEAQLARVAAIEGGEIGVRVNMVNPDAIFEESRLWSPDLREQRARAHGIDPANIDAFYRSRTLLGVSVRAIDVAEAVLFLAGDRASRTTGAMLPIDGGVREAFVR
ncbi:MAG TPA: bifunctional rhamnulose-1-phosphate aldolase/short-chain dehydrogenase [Longimicrobiaceae bacterium]|jgi:rhamnulose-1-phosphate aldolase/alcohol dehydrogenase|nr:bifunctional rhamnulose-1-phosphate aldolase/short-chain dehydrogenase [Longimicrobiaceae bacterium]